MFAMPKFKKGQAVRIIYNRICFDGTINSVIDMKTHYDYYVSVCAGRETLRRNEKDINACCYCSCCCNPPQCDDTQEKILPPKFHIGQAVKTCFGQDDHCGVVLSIEHSGLSYPGQQWNYKVKMCSNDKGGGIKDGVRFHGENLFEAINYCYCSCCCPGYNFYLP